jgi:hypothetical protein
MKTPSKTLNDQQGKVTKPYERNLTHEKPNTHSQSKLKRLNSYNFCAGLDFDYTTGPKPQKPTYCLNIAFTDLNKRICSKLAL